jgi:hypothetical protein
VSPATPHCETCGKEYPGELGMMWRVLNGYTQDLTTGEIKDEPGNFYCPVCWDEILAASEETPCWQTTIMLPK